MLTKSLARFFIGTVKSAKTVIYTVPATNKPSVLKEMTFHNSDSAVVNIKVAINDIPFVDTTIAASDTLFPEKEWFSVLMPGDKVTVETSKDDVVSVFMSGVETVDVSTDT